ncbi:MAG: GNAT family N-acetyltransferase [Candidatus Angelobacter sp.]
MIPEQKPALLFLICRIHIDRLIARAEKQQSSCAKQSTVQMGAGWQMKPKMLTIVQAETPQQIETARALIVEYATWLEFNLCFQGFEEEMRRLPGKYAPPAGRLLLGLWDRQPAGVIALRPLDEDRQRGLCEMKRLYVRPEFRGHEIGLALAERAIAEAAKIGYTRMRLDTVSGKMDHAIAMYRALGFAETVPYYNTPVGETKFMELALAAGSVE